MKAATGIWSRHFPTIAVLEVLEVDILWPRWVNPATFSVLEVLEVDILWPRWVARIGVTRSTQACFLAADRQCTELPLLRLPRLVPQPPGDSPGFPYVTQDLARVGWRGLAAFLPIGPHERPRLADARQL